MGGTISGAFCPSRAASAVAAEQCACAGQRPRLAPSQRPLCWPVWLDNPAPDTSSGRQAGEALVEIGRTYNVSHSTIIRLKGKIWRSVSNNQPIIVTHLSVGL